jgi:HK97 family phage major capsid protein
VGAEFDYQKVLLALKTIEDKILPRVEDQERELRNFGGTSTKTSRALQLLEDKHDALEREMKDIISTCKSRVEQLDTEISRRKTGVLMPGETPRSMSLGEKFVNTREFQEYKSSDCQGNMLKSAKLPGLQTKDIVGGDANLRDVFSVERVQTIYGNPLRPMRIRDLFPIIPTTASAIDYVVETLYDINAATAVEGAEKPESNLQFDDDRQQIATIAHWCPVNRNLVNDVPALQAYINLRLMDGLREVEDRQLLFGDGTGTNLQGLMVTPGIQTFNQSEGAVKDTIIDTLRRAMTRAQLAYYAISGFVLNPLDWEAVELTKATTGLYVWVNVGTGADPMLWKVPVVATTAQNYGEYLTGSFGFNAAVWDREEINMRVSDSHDKYFIRNRLAILVEERIGFTVFRPTAFVAGHFDGSPQS